MKKEIKTKSGNCEVTVVFKDKPEVEKDTVLWLLLECYKERISAEVKKSQSKSM